MDSDTVTLGLDGNVTIEHLATALNGLSALVKALTAEVGEGARVVWLVDGLEVGSAIATIRGETDSPASVEHVIDAYGQIGRSLQFHEPVPFSTPVRTAVTQITSVLNGDITGLRFQTPSDEFYVATLPPKQPALKETQALGAIEGRVDMLTRRGQLRFTLYDILNDRGIPCYLNKGQESLMRDAWGKRVIVRGRVSRDPQTGRPTSIRDITDVTVRPEVPAGSYRQARGIAPPPPGAISAEEAVRRWRDAN